MSRTPQPLEPTIGKPAVSQPIITMASVTAALRGYVHRPLPGGEATRWAGVAAVLRDNAQHGPEVLVIRRTEHPNDPWSGHMAMPGGRVEPSDPSVQAAAERETQEEVGLDLQSSATLLTRLDDVIAVAHGQRLELIIAPFVYRAQDQLQAGVSDEVQELHWVPLRALAGPALRTTVPYNWAGTPLILPGWNWRSRTIWGLTYTMLSQLIGLVLAWGRPCPADH